DLRSLETLRKLGSMHLHWLISDPAHRGQQREALGHLLRFEVGLGVGVGWVIGEQSILGCTGRRIVRNEPCDAVADVTECCSETLECLDGPAELISVGKAESRARH